MIAGNAPFSDDIGMTHEILYYCLRSPYINILLSP